ncbi:inositol monophosphatase (plasmid) [Haloterrigena turkmenica DSM 5511]|uniref:NAD kinase n=1 Tax=Haloterrigena turkmenica (strain ATCC 51198 / DSM 5511 / JCM 9101 / NCIMB 13204 / VKM B-1734 / 4k) TaxID=543526 RepID=D2S0A8_HALTV|nr:inositol monophosphatase family protein [Haloterrigena turkmenica]ADB62805.1 inositol monophosphatase [Haloterrigena turkmenica DSM 5511]
MYGRRLATIEEIIALVSPDSDEELSTLEAWADNHGIPVHAVEVGDDIDSVYAPEREYLGVTLGGDGTYLEGVRQFSPKQIPILGINAGTLAFLASISPCDLTDALDEALRGGATVDRRQQLHVAADRVNCTGINDVMIEHEPPEDPVDRKITRLQVFADGEFVGEYEGSGLAVSTPTGSTGVSLSAGGPVHYPMNNSSLQIVPLHTHQMGVRPLIVDADTTIKVVAEGPANLLVDGGRVQSRLEEDDVVTIGGADTSALVVNTSYDDDFFTSISEKLGWSVREDRHDRGDADRLVETEDDGEVVRQAKQVAEEAAKAAGEALRELHGQTESVEYKSDKSDIVTEADYKADNIITTVIENEFPDHGIRSEESDERVGSSEYTWLIDPLDGTGNFAHGNPNYSISIALVEDEEPVMGVVYAPETDEMFAAIDGEGATLDGLPISTTDRATLDECMLLSGYDPNGAFLSHCYQETRGVRSLGSAALNLCFLAAGSADALWEFDTYPWDVAAGVVIAREAGATLTTANGDRYDPIAAHEARNELVGSNGAVHETLLRHLDEKQDLQAPKQTSAD